jgi:hypothetical protein
LDEFKNSNFFLYEFLHYQLSTCFVFFCLHSTSMAKRRRKCSRAMLCRKFLFINNSREKASSFAHFFFECIQPILSCAWVISNPEFSQWNEKVGKKSFRLVRFWIYLKSKVEEICHQISFIVEINCKTTIDLLSEFFYWKNLIQPKKITKIRFRK